MPSPSRSKPLLLSLLFLWVTIFIVLLILMNAWRPVTADSRMDDTVIAYVSASTGNQEIHLINPDGTDDRSLWRVPTPSDPAEGIGALSWHPSGTELLFDSGHDWQRSMAIRDLYAISADGSTLRRVTSPPVPDDYSGYPAGTVTFVMGAWEQGDVQVYIEGASTPISYFARLNSTYRITQTIADLGDGVRQYVRLWDPEIYAYPCSYSQEGWVDVVPGQITDFGVIPFTVGSTQACPYMFSPSWSQDGSRILYLFREATPSLSPGNNIWQIGTNAPVGTVGSQVLNMNNYVGAAKLYRVVFAPTAAKADEFLFLQNEATNDFLYHATAENAPDHRWIDLGSCTQAICDILDVAWLPDGSGFIFAQFEDGFTSSGLLREGALYRYQFAGGELTEIARLPGEAIGRLAISPDGASIVFERGPSLAETVDEVQWGPTLQCPCELWIVNSDGSGLRQLVADGRAPAWSLVAPDTTPQPTPTPHPNMIPRLWVPRVGS